MKCPHCTVEFHDTQESYYLGRDADGEWILTKRICPACQKMIVNLQNGDQPLFSTNTTRGIGARVSGLQVARTNQLVRPKGSARAPCPAEVPREFADDYLQSCLVLADSPKAAAALGRRCLQNLLRQVAGVKPGNLADEIQQVIDGGRLPSDLADSIDAVRNIGNFAAHPMKSQHSGEILEVNELEADWILDVLEAMFDFFFVRPAKLQKRRDALNQKLTEAGKPPMK